MNALETRPLPIAFGGPGAVTVAGTRHAHARRYRRRQCATHPHDHQPVQHLGDVIPQPSERRPALRAAVPTAGEVPDHLHPRQVRVIPAARPRSRPPLPALPAAASPASIPVTATVIRPVAGPGPFRGPAEQHPLQHRQLGVHPVQLAVPVRQLLTQPRVLLPQPLLLQLPAISASRPFASSAAPTHPAATGPHPLPRAPQPPQSRSTANMITRRKSRTRAGVSHPASPRTRAPSPAHHKTSDYLRPACPRAVSEPQSRSAIRPLVKTLAL